MKLVTELAETEKSVFKSTCWKYILGSSLQKSYVVSFSVNTQCMLLRTLFEHSLLCSDDISTERNPPAS